MCGREEGLDFWTSWIMFADPKLSSLKVPTHDCLGGNFHSPETEEHTHCMLRAEGFCTLFALSWQNNSPQSWWKEEKLCLIEDLMIWFYDFLINNFEYLIKKDEDFLRRCFPSLYGGLYSIHSFSASSHSLSSHLSLDSFCAVQGLCICSYQIEQREHIPSHFLIPSNRISEP